MERAMIGVSWLDHRTIEWIRTITKVRDNMHVIKARKWTWVGHIARLQDSRWTSQVTDWRPMDGSRPRGRPICYMEAECPRQIVMENNADAFIQQVDRYWLNVMMKMMNWSIAILAHVHFHIVAVT